VQTSELSNGHCTMLTCILFPECEQDILNQ